MCDKLVDNNINIIGTTNTITHILSLVPTFAIHISAHRVASGCLSHVALFLEPEGGYVVTFFHFVTMAPEVAVFSMSVISMGPGGKVGGRLGRVQVWESFEVSVAMEDCASAIFAFACPS